MTGSSLDPATGPHLPLHEFDPSPDAIINPSIHRAPLGFPERAVTCWFGNVVAERTAGLSPVHNVPFEHGDHGIFVIQHNGTEIALVQAALQRLQVLAPGSVGPSPGSSASPGASTSPAP